MSRAGPTASHRQALTLFCDLRQRLGEARAVHDLGAVPQETGDYPAAASQRQAVTLFCDLRHRLAAEGLTNREIGQQLYLSHRTIGNHLYRIFPKLGITSRARLAAILGTSPAPP